MQNLEDPYTMQLLVLAQNPCKYSFKQVQT